MITGEDKPGYMSEEERAGEGVVKGAMAAAAKSALVICALAVLLEVFVFNFNFFSTLGNQEVVLDDKIKLSRSEDGLYRLDQFDHRMDFVALNTDVSNIRFRFDPDQPAQLLQFRIRFTDEAHQSYFSTTDFTQGVPLVDVSTTSVESCYVHVHPAGEVEDLCIELVGDEVSYPVKLKGLSVNAPEPFVFNFGRFAAAFFIVYLGWLFRPHSRIYRIGMVEESRFTKRCIVFAAAVEIVIVSAYLFFGSNLVGIATQSYNWGAWDGESIVNVYEAGGRNAQQYAMLAQSFAEGHLYLDEEPPRWLGELEDPYDKGARDEAVKVHGDDYLFDTAYYKGKYYVYFGVVPVLLFHLPFHLLTGSDFPTALGVLIAMIAFLLGCTALLDRFARYHFKRVSLGLFLLLQIPLVMCCGALYLLKFPTFYSLPLMCGLAFSVWGLYLWMRGRVSKSPGLWYAGGSLCMALVVGCRPQMLALSLVALPLFWRLYVTERRLFTKQGAREFACLIAPYVVVAMGLMWYNAARFGSPFDFGANYNLTVHDMPKRGLSIGRIAPALFAYFLQPPTVTGVFPFVTAVGFATTFMGETVREATYGGILACLPMLWILPFAQPILRMRFEQRSTNTIAGVVLVLLASGVVVALFDAELAGILQRYFADFTFMFLASAVLLAFIVNENLEHDSLPGRLFNRTLSVLVAFSLVYSVLLCFVPETGWYSDVYSWAYQDIVEAFEFWA